MNRLIVLLLIVAGVALVSAGSVVHDTVDDAELAEASGLASSLLTPGILYTHNDSGGAPTVYTLNRRGLAVLLVEQKLTIALDISQRCYVMGHGEVVFHGTPDELRADSGVRPREGAGVTGRCEVAAGAATTLHRDDRLLPADDRRDVAEAARVSKALQSTHRCARRFRWALR